MILMFTISLSALVVSFYENYNDARVIYKQIQINNTGVLEYAFITECVLLVTVLLLFVLGIGLLILALKTIMKKAGSR